MRGRDKWLRQLKAWKGQLFQGHDHPLPQPPPCPKRPSTTTSSTSSGVPEGEQGKAVEFACPTCGTLSDSKRAAFSLTNLDTRTWCRRCKVSRYVRAWQCQCGTQWHLCPTHVTAPAMEREEHAGAPQRSRRQTDQTTPHPPSRARRGTKRNGDWLDAPPKRTRTTAAQITFSTSESAGIKGFDPQLLSPSLKRRFAHLCTDVK